MRLYRQPPYFETRVRFAWRPVRVDNGDIVWWEHYEQMYCGPYRGWCNYRIGEGGL